MNSLLMHLTILKVDFLAVLFADMLSPILSSLLSIYFSTCLGKKNQGDELFAREQASTNYSS